MLGRSRAWPVLTGGAVAILAALPLQAEFQVNTFTTNAQWLPAISRDRAGNFVVVWSSWQDGDTWGNFGQRFDSMATAQGAEFQINSFTTSDQRFASISHDPDGNFVVVWSSYAQDGHHWGVFGQRFDSMGNSQGTEFQINTFTTFNQSFPDLSHDSNGNFVVVWRSYFQDGSDESIFGQRFFSTGAAQGSEFQINSYTLGRQRYPIISHDPAAGFAVVWQSFLQDGSLWGVFGQRFDSLGNAQGSEFQINSFTSSDQTQPVISHDPAGNFVVIWSSKQDGSEEGVFGQRFDNTGAAQGTEFQVNSFTTDLQWQAAISHGSAGGFMVVWDSFAQDGDVSGIFGQSFDGMGAPLGGEFQVNSYTTSHQTGAALCHLSANDFVVVWASLHQDGSFDGVFGERFIASLLVTGPGSMGGSRTRLHQGN